MDRLGNQRSAGNAGTLAEFLPKKMEKSFLKQRKMKEAPFYRFQTTVGPGFGFGSVIVTFKEGGRLGYKG